MKKIIISPDVLKPALKKLGQLVNEKTVLPVTKNIYCIVGKNEVEMVTTDLENFISFKCVAETGGQDGFELLLPYDYLSKVVAECKDAPITIEHPSARKARIVCDSDVFEINSLDKPEDFPKVPAVAKRAMHTLSAQFVELLTKALLTCSKDNIRPAMTRVCMDMVLGNVNLVSTDAHVMYKHKIGIEVTENMQLQFSAKTIKALQGMETVELSWTAKMICLKGETVTVWARRHDDKYPDYKVVIPTYEANLQVEKSDLVSALRKALISNISSRQTSLYPKKEAGQLLFDADDPDNSRMIHVKIPGEYTGNVDMISINANKLLTIMEQVDGQRIKLHIHSPSKAILISTEEDADYLGLLMPILPATHG